MQPVPYVWKLSTGKPGPTLMVMGGTHGDELPGVEAVRLMLKRFGLLNQPAGEYPTQHILAGNLILALGNPEAILRCTRYAQGPRDLNRSFSPSDLSAAPTDADTLDVRRARELAPVLQTIDVLLDVHSTSEPSTPFICSSNSSDRHRELARLIPVRHFLTDPDLVLPRDFGLTCTGTTDYYVNTFAGSAWSVEQTGKRQGVALCYETGHSQDITVLPTVMTVIDQFLAQLGLVNGHPETKPHENTAPAEYKLAHAAIAQEDTFVYEPGVSNSWVDVQQGQLVGHYPSGAEEHFPTDGILVMPRSGKLVEKGRSFYYLAERVA